MIRTVNNIVFVPRFKFLVVLSVILILISCYTRKEGCLDQLASNFDVTADDSCPDCCTDPFISLTTRHLAGDTILSPNITLLNDLQQSYRILNFSYYLSGFQIITEGGNKITVNEKITFNGSSGRFEQADDFGIYRINIVSRNLGKTRAYGNYSGFEFTLGLQNAVMENTAIDLPMTHVLNDSLRLKNPNQLTAHQIITVAAGESFKDTTTYYITGIESGIHFRIDSMFNNSIGTNINLRIKADYSRWFQKADFSKSQEEIENVIRENSKFIFSVN